MEVKKISSYYKCNTSALKDRIDDIATNSKNKNIRHMYRGINEFKRGFQPSSNLVKDKNDVYLQIPTTF
jgi:hypothetical protein